MKKIFAILSISALLAACSSDYTVFVKGEIDESDQTGITDPENPEPQNPDPQNPEPQNPDPQNPTECTDKCEAGSECLTNTSFRICRDENGDGCREWVTVECTGGSVCEAGTCETAAPVCTDECTGGTECLGDDAFRTCQAGNDGCRKWVVTQCKAEELCEGGKCIVPVPPCADTCDGSARCDGKSGYQLCMDTDGDGCKEWASTKVCPSGQECQNGNCVTPAPTCTNACSSGAVQCSGKDLQSCKDTNGDGCTEWAKDKTCDYKCEGNKCVDNPLGWVPACSGDQCPTVITDFSKTYSGNTSNGQNKISNYGGKCPDTNESGPEQSYIMKVTESGYLIAGITEPSGGDVDVHILKGTSAGDCLARSDVGAIARVDAGIYYVYVDTYAKASNAGSYKLKVTFIPDSGKCGMNATTINRYNGASSLYLPTSGKVVAEAHLVTTNDQKAYGKNWWPNSINQNLSAHKAYTDSLFGSGTSSGNEWCPSGEGGCQYGQGCTGSAVPPDAEAWYINMLWKNKPKPGTRFLVINPVNGKAVVSAAGYETGPYDNSRMGGAVYEVHHYLGTAHLSVLTFGEMKNQSLAFGPIDCSK